MSSYCYYAGKTRQAANRTGQGNDTEYRGDAEDREDTEDKEDTEDQIVTYQEGGSSVEEPAAGNKNNELIVDIECCVLLKF